MVVEDEHVVDAGVLADERDEFALPHAVAPDHRRVVERVGDGGGGRDALAQGGRGRRGEGGQVDAEPLGLVGAEPRVAARAGEDGQAAAARPGAADGERLRELEQLVRVGRPRRAGLLHERAEDAVVAGHRARVRGGGRRADRGRTDLQHRDRDAGVRARRQRLAQARAVAVVLDQQRDRAHLRLGGQVLEVVRRRQHRLVPARDRRVQPQPAPGRERVDGEVAALRDERHVARLLQHERVAPQRRAGVERDQAIAVGAADGQRVAERRVSQLMLELGMAALAEARREDHRAAAAERARLLDDVGHTRGGDRDDDRVGHARQVCERREARHAVGLGPARVDAPDVALEADGAQVEQGLAAVGVAVVGGSHDGDRARVEEPGEVH